MWSIGLVIFQIRFNVNHKDLSNFMTSLGILDNNKTVSDRHKLVDSMFAEIKKKWSCML